MRRDLSQVDGKGSCTHTVNSAVYAPQRLFGHPCKENEKESPLKTISLNLQKVRILIHQEVEQCEERSGGEPNHIVVIAFDFPDEKTAETLKMIFNQFQRQPVAGEEAIYLDGKTPSTI